MTNLSLAAGAQPFLDDLQTWLETLPTLPVNEVLPHPQKAAVLSVDVITGFCESGSLASPRVGRIVTPIAQLMTAVWDAGLRHIALMQDTHEENAVEFGAWPAHCVRGSHESETVEALRRLPFYPHMTVLPKNSIHPALNTGLDAWLAERPELDTFIVVGDCTDLCTYQLAMHIRLSANAYQRPWRVIVPAECVDTYDRPLEDARTQGGWAHPADLLHAVFLYHMALNGMEVVRAIR